MQAAGKPQEIATKPRPRWHWRWLRALAIVYCVVLLVVSMLQNWMLFPGHNTQGQPRAQVSASAGNELVYVTSSNGDRIALLFGRATDAAGRLRDDASARPTIIFFCGNGNCLAHSVYYFDEWRKRGANVVLMEYPGYGMSSGQPGEQPIYAAVDAAYDWLMARSDIDKRKIIPVGMSLGSGVAIDLASRRPCAGLATFAAYTSIDDMAQKQMPWIPTRFILRHHFRSIDKIGRLQIPILMIHGQHDSLIPVEMTHRLAAAATKAQVTKVIIDSDHNDMFNQHPEELHDAVAELVERVAGGG